MGCYETRRHYVNAVFWNGANYPTIREFIGLSRKIAFVGTSLVITTKNTHLEVELGQFLVRKNDVVFVMEEHEFVEKYQKS